MSHFAHCVNERHDAELGARSEVPVAPSIRAYALG